MTTPIGSIACSNPQCGHNNPATARTCSACGAPLALVYLYAIGPNLKALRAGDWVDNRYFYLGDRCFLDGKPADPPDVPHEVTQATLNYLRLFEHRPQIPQIYGIIKHASTGRDPIILLEGAPIAPDGSLLPRLLEQWPHQSPLRQLNWLWQLARLWDPLQEVNSTATLFDPDRLRVGGGWVRLLSLKDNAGRSQSLAEWGRWWVQKLVPHPMIEPVVVPLVQQVALGRMDAAMLAAALEQTINLWACQDLPVDLASATLSDSGPSRSRNEDACYPPSPGQSTGQRYGLVMVCDGLGGHEGGDVASRLAIEILTTQLAPFVEQAAAHPPTSATVTQTLIEAIAAANSAIAQRNNDEGRSERQRMGTTVVLALMIERSLYLAHVGDSRAYQITATGCYPLTLDDDLATRESRLGLGFYRDLLQIGSAGALVQALGMGPSENLSPTVRHLILDEDCEIVLCSDGVSDFDLIERSWRELFLPSLGEGEAVATVQRAIALANQHNGHDNATIALLQIRAASQVLPTQPLSPIDTGSLAPGPVSEIASTTLVVGGTADPPPPPAPEGDPLVALPPDRRRRRRRRRRPDRPVLAPWLGGLALTIAIGGGLALLAAPIVRQLIDANRPQPSPSALSPSPSASPSPVVTLVAPSTAAIVVGSIVLVQPQASPLALYRAMGSQQPVGWLPPNSTIQIARILPDANPTAGSPPITWVQIKLCRLGVANPPDRLASSPPTEAPATSPKGTFFLVRQADLSDRIVPWPPTSPNPCAVPLDRPTP